MPPRRFVFKDGWNRALRKPRALEKAPELWDEHKDTLREKFLVEDLPTTEVARYMRSTFNFDATIRQYNHRFQLWAFTKKGHFSRNRGFTTNTLAVACSGQREDSSVCDQDNECVGIETHNGWDTAVTANTSDEIRSYTPDTIPSLLVDHASPISDSHSSSVRTPLDLSPAAAVGFDTCTQTIQLPVEACRSLWGIHPNPDTTLTTLSDDELDDVLLRFPAPARRKVKIGSAISSHRPESIFIENDDKFDSNWSKFLASLNCLNFAESEDRSEHDAECIEDRVSWLDTGHESEDEATSDDDDNDGGGGAIHPPVRPRAKLQTSCPLKPPMLELGDNIFQSKDKVVGFQPAPNSQLPISRLGNTTSRDDTEQDSQCTFNFISVAIMLLERHHNGTPIDIPLAELNLQELYFTTVTLPSSSRTSGISLENFAAITLSRIDVLQLQASDFTVLVRLCEFLLAAHLYEDCFKLSYVCWQILNQHPISEPSLLDEGTALACKSIALNLVRSSTRPEHLEIVSQIIRQLARCEDVIEQRSDIDNAIWCAHLGDLLCRFSSSAKPEEVMIDVWKMLQTLPKNHNSHLALHISALTAKKIINDCKVQEPTTTNLHNLQIIIDDASNHGGNDANTSLVRIATRQVLTWCRGLMQKREFAEMIKTMDGSLWNPTATESFHDVIKFEETLSHLYMCSCYWGLTRLKNTTSESVDIESAFHDIHRTSGISPENLLRSIVGLAAGSGQNADAKLTRSTMAARHAARIDTLWNHTAMKLVDGLRGGPRVAIPMLVDQYVWPGHPQAPKYCLSGTRWDAIRQILIDSCKLSLDTAQSHWMEFILTWLRGSEALLRETLLPASTRSSQMSTDCVNFRNTYKSGSRNSRKSVASSFRAYTAACEDSILDHGGCRKLFQQPSGSTFSLPSASRIHSSVNSQRNSDRMSICTGSENV